MSIPQSVRERSVTLAQLTVSPSEPCENAGRWRQGGSARVHLDPLGAEERAIWDRYVKLVDAAGPAEMIVTKSRIAFRAPHRICVHADYAPQRAAIQPLTVGPQ